MSVQPKTIAQAKDQAAQLRREMAEQGRPMGQGKALEQVAKRHGFHDWNTMSAALGKAAVTVGDRVTGRFMGQPFTGEVREMSELRPGWVHLSLHLDEAVDVVTSDAFSNLRKRVRGVVGPKGQSVEKTSDGQPHLQLDNW
ncbi:hypothetical protein K3728_08495 [Rhodobacteraceae bacterium M385]|nr:hypothetical protein K3728_08495 [Rhodobacteraceae bacterium M385]